MQTHRRNYSSAFKAQRVLEYLQGRMPAEICREHALSPNLLYKWHKEFQERISLVFENNKTEKGYQEKMEKLERIIGKQAIEIDFLKRGLSMFN